MIINPENAGVLTREIQLCMIRGPDFSWIKVQSTSKAVLDLSTLV